MRDACVPYRYARVLQLIQLNLCLRLCGQKQSVHAMGLASWLPACACDIQEEAAQATLRKIQRCQVHVPLLQRSLPTAYLETAAAADETGSCVRIV